MINKLDPSNFPMQIVDPSILLAKIATGNAVLFVGSGFSSGAISLDGGALPTAEVLAESIGKLGGFDPHKDLRYASERFLRVNDAQRLIDHLESTFTVKKVLPHQVSISSAPWRRIYTTNYDLCIERAGEEVGKLIKTANLSDSPSELVKSKTLCVHLNGSLKSLSKDTVNSTFKLSHSSYLSTDSFTSSKWNYSFRRDLEMCSALVFVGYSLYDIEIEKILYENKTFSDKTFFVTRSEVNEITRFKMEPFGTILAIGAENFGAMLDEHLPSLISDQVNLGPLSIPKYIHSQADVVVRDSDVDRFLMYGDIQDRVVDWALTSGHATPILVRRTALSSAIKFLNENNNLVISGEMGNGKTILLRSLTSELALEGGAVYVVEQSSSYNFHDLEKIAELSTVSYLVIDSYEQHVDLIRHFYTLNPKHVKLVLAARTAIHERNRSKLVEIGMDFHEMYVDELEDVEVLNFISIIDNVGFWGDKAYLSESGKQSFIADSNRRQVSLSLLTLLQAPQMTNRVASLVKRLVTDENIKSTVFSISLLGFLDMPLNSSLIAEVAGTDVIFSPGLRDNPDFLQVFRVEGSSVKAKSSLFALTLIKDHFSAAYTVDKLISIVAILNDAKGDSRDKAQLLKSLLRFSVVERMLSETLRKNNLVKYYEQLKHVWPSLKNDPHFWLQYAMALLTYDDFSKAQVLLNQAYALASRKDGYHTVQMDTQQSRLYIKLCLTNSSPQDAFKLFNDANLLLRKVPNDIHKFRQVEKYKDVYETNYRHFGPGQKVAFEQACKAAIADIDILIDAGTVSYSSIRVVQNIRSSLVSVVESILASRTA
ncbi:SIR2 family protein [Pseudomonas quasicaspiana]|uniref:SIR2 family protein n=1 Tax=Pseudomonas quasicaspiana TaxID=2829821 RepID=UPI001E604012|nr:SIR2 family protein [Pseudomonas quasicaspiana]MCD5977195.1 SIR2 family protein [Pseudomonas quasicaspiana]